MIRGSSTAHTTNTQETAGSGEVLGRTTPTVDAVLLTDLAICTDTDFYSFRTLRKAVTSVTKTRTTVTSPLTEELHNDLQ